MTLIEASLHFNTASLTPFLIVSLIPTIAKRIKSVLSKLSSKFMSIFSNYSFAISL